MKNHIWILVMFVIGLGIGLISARRGGGGRGFRGGRGRVAMRRGGRRHHGGYRRRFRPAFYGGFGYGGGYYRPWWNSYYIGDPWWGASYYNYPYYRNYYREPYYSRPVEQSVSPQEAARFLKGKLHKLEQQYAQNPTSSLQQQLSQTRSMIKSVSPKEAENVAAAAA